MTATRKPTSQQLMIATTTYFGPDHLVITEGTIVNTDHPEPKDRPSHWKPVTPAVV